MVEEPTIQEASRAKPSASPELVEEYTGQPAEDHVDDDVEPVEPVVTKVAKQKQDDWLSGVKPGKLFLL